MWRLVLGLIFFFPVYVFAGSCQINMMGYFNTSAAASSACTSSSPTGFCGSFNDSGDYGFNYAFSYPISDPSAKSYNAGANNYSWCNGQTDPNRNAEGFVYLFGTCPAGTITDPVSGECGCEGNYQLNPFTLQCDALPIDDDFSDEGSIFDDSENTGGGDNEFGGDGGSECNFSPEGCAPGDKPNTPDIADIDAPDPSDPAPPDAVTTGSKTESNPDGSTTTTTSRSWEESDGSIVKETVKETINPDGSKTTEKTITRDSPNGSSATTTVKSQTDSQGNTTISGTSSEKQTEKEGSVSGGNTCDVAPSCNGDAVLCAVVHQQWLTRCDKNTEYADSDCSSQPMCKGDVLLCAGLINQWQDRCSMQNAPTDAQKFFEDRGFKTAEQYNAEGGILESVDNDVSSLANSVLSSRSAVVGSCPADISFTAGAFGDFSLSLEPFCMLAEEIYWLVILSAYMTASFIIFRAITN